MINNIEYIANKRTLIRVTTDKGIFSISYKDIRPYWNYARPSHFEEGKAILSGDNLIFSVLTASGQGGVVCVWNCNENRLIHISEGAFFETAVIFNDKLYVLRNVYCWGTPPHLRLSTCPLGTMDACYEGTFLYADVPTKIDNYDEALSDVKILVENDEISLRFGEKTVLFTKNVSNAITFNEKYSEHYTNNYECDDSQKTINLKFHMLL